MSGIKQALSNGPLSVVLMQVQFSPIDQIKKYIPAFQDYLQGIEYPLYSSREPDIVCLGQHGEPEKAIFEQWYFSSSDTQQTIILDNERLTYQVFDIQFSSFENIFQNFLTIVKEFDALVKISIISRLGLRYIHSIQEKEDVSWKDLVTKEFQGPSFPADGDWIENELRSISAQRGVLLEELAINSNFRYVITQNAIGRKYIEGIERFPTKDPEFFDPKCLVTHLDLDHFVILTDSPKLEVFDCLPGIFTCLNSVIEEMFFGAMLTDKAKKTMTVVPQYPITDPLLDGSSPSYALEAGAAYGYKESDAGSSIHSVQAYSPILDTDRFDMSTDYKSKYKRCNISDRKHYTPFQSVNPCKNFSRFDNHIDTSVNPNKTNNVLVLKNHNEQFISLSRFFGFNKTEWAEIFSVSRPTIYGWLKNELKPSGENARKISRLYSLLNAIPNRQEDDRLFKRYIYHHISACNCSLFEIFKSGMPSGYVMSDLVEIVSSLLERAQKKANELDKLEKVGLASEATLDHNLDDLLNCLE